MSNPMRVGPIPLEGRIQECTRCGEGINLLGSDTWGCPACGKTGYILDLKPSVESVRVQGQAQGRSRRALRTFLAAASILGTAELGLSRRRTDDLEDEEDEWMRRQMEGDGK